MVGRQWRDAAMTIRVPGAVFRRLCRMANEEGISPQFVAASLLEQSVGLGIHKRRTAEVRRLVHVRGTITILEVAEACGINYHAAARLLRRLVKRNVLVAETLNRKRVFRAPRRHLRKGYTS